MRKQHLRLVMRPRPVAEPDGPFTWTAQGEGKAPHFRARRGPLPSGKWNRP